MQGLLSESKAWMWNESLRGICVRKITLKIAYLSDWLMVLLKPHILKIAWQNILDFIAVFRHPSYCDVSITHWFHEKLHDLLFRFLQSLEIMSHWAEHVTSKQGHTRRHIPSPFVVALSGDSPWQLALLISWQETDSSLQEKESIRYTNRA